MLNILLSLFILSLLWLIGALWVYITVLTHPSAPLSLLERFLALPVLVVAYVVKKIT